MELWIRSQNKELLIQTKIVELECFGEEAYTSINARFEGKNGSLGIYKTKERALEVLDEIQDLMRSLADSELKIIQYEMPQE